MDRTSGTLRFSSFQHFKQAQGRAASDREQPPAFITVAIDELSYVRSTLGYTTGEQVLELCAERLLAETRDGDAVVALSGDTFAVILNGPSDEFSVRRIAERLMEKLERSYLVDGHLVDIQVSAGIAISCDGLQDVDALLKRSSLALRTARNSHSRVPCFFEARMEQGLVSEQAVVQELRKALPLRQFTLHYQPQVSVAERRVVGVEALLRWTHPVRGLISPDVFIPLAESMGTIHALGAWVLRTACKQAATLPSNVKVAVNVSPVQLRNADFAEQVSEALATAKLPGSRLEIEITEGILLDSAETTLSTIQAVRALGVEFAIDDFGTGYSSLGQIGKFPFSTVKIDRSLVGPDQTHRAVVRAVVALANGLDMQVLAEGVETDHDLKALQADGCSLFQGYFFCKPVPGPELLKRLEQVNSAPCLNLPEVRKEVTSRMVPSCRRHAGRYGRIRVMR